MTMHTVTYSAEDNKLRLYVGRVPRDEYERLRAAGFVSTPKQDCDFVATWTPGREDLAREYLGDDEDIGDEDYSPEERAADRAERFSDYRDKRAAEAGASADAFDAGPSAFGHQNRARAERQARRHDRKRVYAVSQWSKAEYWQQRTAGVIAHALHRSSAHVRRGRILTLEAEQRKHEKEREEYAERFGYWSKVATLDGANTTDRESLAYRLAYTLANSGSGWRYYKHPRRDLDPAAYEQGRKTLYCLLTDETDPITPAEAAALWLDRKPAPDDDSTYSARWSKHYELRLTYERAMLEAEGGTAGNAEMEPGGWIRGGRRGGDEWRQIHKVNRSPATKRVTSVHVMGTTTGYTKESNYTKCETRSALVRVNVERLPEDAYRAPTDEEREQFKTAKKAAKAAKPTVSTINPTDEDAERLQSLWNEQAANSARERGRAPSKPREVKRMTQAQYSHYSGPDSMYQIKPVTIGGVTFKIRKAHRGFYDYDAAESVIVLTDKPQKPLPIDWEAAAATLGGPEDAETVEA